MAGIQEGNSDITLIQEAARGDGEAFSELFRRHHRKVYNYAYWLCHDPELAEDLTQEAFARAYEHLDRFGPPWKLRSWLYRLVRNRFYDHAQEQNPLLALDTSIPLPSKAPGPERHLSQAEVIARVRRTIHHLPDPHREALVLRVFDQLSYEDIAQTMGISLSYVRVLLHRARGQFKRSYQISLLAEEQRPHCDVLNELLDCHYDGGPLTPAEVKLIETHLEGCPTCQQRQRELVALSALLGVLPPLLPPASLLENFERRLAQREPSQDPAFPASPASEPGQKSLWKKPIVVGTLLVVILGAVGIGGFMFYSGSGGFQPLQVDDDSEDVDNPPEPCGDGICDPAVENEQNCPADCTALNMVSSPTCSGDCTVPPPADSPGGGTCQLALSCGNGVCDTDCENSDLCPADCQCVDDAICSPGEGANCKDCSDDPAAQCGVACDEGACSTGLSCADGICWDACLCGGQCGGSGSGGVGGCVCGDGICDRDCGENPGTCGDC